MEKAQKDALGLILSLAAGIISFCYFADIKILNPTYITWLMEGDPAQHYLGWSTFRSTPILQWPLGLNYNYGMDVSNSIVYTDSIPLVAIVLKFFNAFLPNEFQYTGWWLLLCYILMSFFGYKLTLKLTNSNYIAVLTGFLLSFSPSFIQRTGIHYALCAQFLLIVALYFYIRKVSNKKWIFLLCLTATIHAYLLAMIFCIYFARLGVEFYERNKDYKVFFKKIFYSTFTCVFVMYAVGYFVIHHGFSIGGFGIFRTDVLSIFNPESNYYSRFLKVNNNQLNSDEGQAYLGLGVIMISLFCISHACNSYKKGRLKILSPSIIIPSLVLFGMYLFAVSNVVSIMGWEVFTVHLPHKMIKIFNTFRASGRFIWPLVYVIFISSVYCFFKESKKACLYFFPIIVALQFFDISEYGKEFSRAIEKTSHTGEMVVNQDYKVDYSKYTSIMMLLPEDFDDKSSIIYLAASHNLPVNSGYMARYDGQKIDQQTQKLHALIASEDLDPTTIYFVGKSAESLKKVCSKNYVCETGYSGTMIYFKK